MDRKNFKEIEAPKRRQGLAVNQLAVSKHSITVPADVAAKLGSQVSILWSDVEHAIALAKSPTGVFKLRTIGKGKTKSIYCRQLLDTKLIKAGRYTATYDEKDSVFVAPVTVVRSAVERTTGQQRAKKPAK